MVDDAAARKAAAKILECSGAVSFVWPCGARERGRRWGASGREIARARGKGEWGVSCDENRRRVGGERARAGTASGWREEQALCASNARARDVR
eukprot:2384093-Prymnesium_polylepis.1